MAANDKDWEVPAGVTHRASFMLSRYLEYTDPSIELKLKPVSSETLAYLAEIPALFMSEIKEDREGHATINIRVGTVENLQVISSEIQYEFRIERDLGSVRIDDRERFRLALAMGQWELHRTHWAVKEGDLMRALADLGLADHAPVPSEPLPLPLPPDSTKAEWPTIDKLEDYLARVLALKIEDGEEIFYRGHSDSSYRLEPALFRRNKAGEYRYRQKEQVLVREIQSSQASEFSTDVYMLDQLVRMQHYGLPTRLLDISYNPLIALYFACANPKYDATGNETDGEVIILRTQTELVKFFDSDTVSCISNLSLLSGYEQDGLDTSLELNGLNGLPSCKKLLHFIRREKPYFESRIDPADLDKILFVRGRNTNERVISQSGAFLLFGKDAVLPETGHSTLQLERIKIQNKAQILIQLSKLNIKSDTVFPGIEKTTAEIARKHEIK
ncbi:FRG domain-containing protein [Sphingobium fuliginis]|uniref:FRG domain-containing protein n=1 Tax=Sphingobium fuliginis ATCC 27551 TaxID=1208342 RepID=A0A5B8CJP6_SPHSA|nr:FRG domain-containing protein [Sphingobium fuliginis]QDC39015.1 FRG domain-containing protein [Sphingobium fuliginis ATCC 27551]